MSCPSPAAATTPASKKEPQHRQRDVCPHTCGSCAGRVQRCDDLRRHFSRRHVHCTPACRAFGRPFEEFFKPHRLPRRIWTLAAGGATAAATAGAAVRGDTAANGVTADGAVGGGAV